MLKHKTEIDEAEINRVALKLFFAITQEWGLNDAERCVLAGTRSRTTLHGWRRKIDEGQTVSLSHDTQERLSYIAGIYKALQILFSEPAQWKNWVHKANRDFAGQSAMQRMLNGRVIDLADVRRYLDGWRGAAYG